MTTKQLIKLLADLDPEGNRTVLFGCDGYLVTSKDITEVDGNFPSGKPSELFIWLR